jgi:hypothetical protein
LKLLLALASAIVAWTLQTQPARAQSHPLSNFCQGGVVITGTPFTRVQLRRAAGNQITPELVQAAAFTAAVLPEQQLEVRTLRTARLRANTRWREGTDEILFGLLYEDAANAQRSAGITNKVIGGTVGGVLGLVTGSFARGAAGSIAGGSLGLPIVEAYVEILMDQALSPALDELIRHPCEVSAAQVLDRVRAGP